MRLDMALRVLLFDISTHYVLGHASVDIFVNRIVLAIEAVAEGKYADRDRVRSFFRNLLVPRIFTDAEQLC